MGLLTSLAVSLVFTCFLNSSDHCESHHNGNSLTARVEISPRWRINLQDSLPHRPLGVVVGHGHETHGKPKTSVWFLDNATIAVTFVFQGEPGSLSRRDTTGLENSPLQLLILRIDASTGKVLDSQQLSTQSRFSAIIAVSSNGSFVVQRGDELTVFSLGGKLLQSRTLPHSGDVDWYPHASPTGKSIVFIKPNLRTTEPVPWLWVDTETLSILRSWEVIQSGWVTISDLKLL